MSTPKEDLTRLIESQPDDASYDEIVRELALHVMIQRGLADSDARRTISNDECCPIIVPPWPTIRAPSMSRSIHEMPQ